ncbi:MAG: oligopeptide transporter, OPT family [Saprospiraceae bacterium]|nr:oligopeptide transporter, OPT family [Saprospiraceae bacterium]MCF8252764.1 oligopeptide transporter, OPT family [Saprospiraceae bacterium]MCF8283136.1 oligopeptide transporter, OPT family [Bacteroidales bacterium]MCF8314326.1 oligopeptide transporter, OPT family [Saprospiraceae bacterium]MCF8443191.1 oligopeptide transporter, OPT family [Saprospiraceae bacterium]
MKEKFKPYIASENTSVKEFTVKAIILGSIFGIIFGASTVYLALKAGLTVSASIPIAVLAISLGQKFFGTTILENNIIQTTGSAGESIAAGVVFTLPAFLFLSDPAVGDQYFRYWTIFALAVLGGILGTLMMVPLRRSLIVKEHENLPYPEGTACASVLIAGDKGGSFAKTAYQGLGFAFAYALLQKIFHVISEVPSFGTTIANKYFPSATLSGEITPEYLGVGYIIGPRIAGVLVAGGVLAWLALIPLLATLVPADMIALQMVKLGYLAQDATTGLIGVLNKETGQIMAGGPGGWDPVAHTFADSAEAIYRAYVRQIGAGAVAAGGLITLLKTIPTIISSFKESVGALKERNSGNAVSRTDNDLSMKVVGFGSLALIVLMALLPIIPGDGILSKLMLGVLVVLFGFFFVTVSSRIVGIIGSSNNPISGMTIATIMATALVFIGIGWTGKAYEPMVLVVGGMICVAAANAGATSQDLKTGYIVGATPKYQQLALFIGALVSSVVIGLTVKYLDTPTPDMVAQGIQHAIGEKFAAPQATLMATLIKGLLSFNLDWQFVLVGVFVAIVVELCGVSSLSFAVGLYLPLSTTLPIFLGGALKGGVEWAKKRKGEETEGDNELGKGNLFATGLVAGGALAGVIVAILSVRLSEQLNVVNLEEHFFAKFMSPTAFMLMGVGFFAFMGWVLWRVARKAD